jgi:argininosuccinate lyase
MKKLWDGRFTAGTLPEVEAFLASIEVDHLLVEFDIAGSIAHCSMLGACGIITASDASAIVSGLRAVLAKITSQSVAYTAADEDVHMWVERLLHEEIGPVAGKLHTGRSRNDQVAVDTHLYARAVGTSLVQLLVALQRALLNLCDSYPQTVLPGYTHLQRAQPILWSHHLMAYAWMFQRDCDRMRRAVAAANICPLGAGALAGTTFAIDRELVASSLKFDALYENSIDAVADRDYLLDILSGLSIVMMHLTRLSEELVLWTSAEFAFVRLADTYCTGSSIMPQKRNPDCAELIRGKCGRVYGALFNLLTTLKGLPLAYNKDLQEDKEALFDAVSTTRRCLSIMTGMLTTAAPREENMARALKEGFVNATELADYLAAKGVPFREAHHRVGRLVLECERQGLGLEDMPLSDLAEANPEIDQDVYDVLKPLTAVRRRLSRGGTAPDAIAQQRTYLEEAIRGSEAWLATAPG